MKKFATTYASDKMLGTSPPLEILIRLSRYITHLLCEYAECSKRPKRKDGNYRPILSPISYPVIILSPPQLRDMCGAFEVPALNFLDYDYKEIEVSNVFSFSLSITLLSLSFRSGSSKTSLRISRRDWRKQRLTMKQIFPSWRRLSRRRIH